MNKIHYTRNRVRPMQYELGECGRNAFVKNYISHIDGFCNYNPKDSWNVMYSDGKRERGEFPNCKKCLKKYLDKVYFKRHDVVADVTYVNKKVKVVVCGNNNSLEFDYIKDAEDFLREQGFVEYLK